MIWILQLQRFLFVSVQCPLFEAGNTAKVSFCLKQSSTSGPPEVD